MATLRSPTNIREQHLDANHLRVDLHLIKQVQKAEENLLADNSAGILAGIIQRCNFRLIYLSIEYEPNNYPAREPKIHPTTSINAQNR
mgnify:CR=1 FL=1